MISGQECLFTVKQENTCLRIRLTTSLEILVWPGEVGSKQLCGDSQKHLGQMF